MHLTSIAIHPVKSTAIRQVTRAQVGPAGLVGDREWMVVDADGEMVSAREERRLFTITAHTAATVAGDAIPARPDDQGQGIGDLVLDAPGVTPLVVSVPRPDAGQREVRMFGSTELLARPAGPEIGEWLSRVVDRQGLSLVWCDDPTRRSLSRGREGDHAAFQDGYPVTLLSAESVTRLNDWMVEEALERGEEPPSPITAERFRPNLLLEGAEEPFAEDEWARVRVGDVVLRRAKLVSRCVMTTIDPADLSGGADPIRTLARHRRWDGATWCAVHYIPETTGTVTVGDPVVPL